MATFTTVHRPGREATVGDLVRSDRSPHRVGVVEDCTPRLLLVRWSGGTLAIVRVREVSLIGAAARCEYCLVAAPDHGDDCDRPQEPARRYGFAAPHTVEAA